MKQIEKLNWHDEIIDGKSTDMKDVKKTIDWYEKIKKKFKLKGIRILKTK